MNRTGSASPVIARQKRRSDAWGSDGRASPGSRRHRLAWKPRCILALALLTAGAGPASRPTVASPPPAAFMGTDGRARSVVYLCDASGSMVSVFGQLKQELKKSASVLADGQTFNVIFFHGDTVDPLFTSGPEAATAENKRMAVDFIDNYVSVGGTNPIPAVRLALKSHPDLLFVLTDGFDQVHSHQPVIDEFKRDNPGGKTHVNCVYLQADPNPKLLAALRQITADGHGSLKVISKKDM